MKDASGRLKQRNYYRNYFDLDLNTTRYIVNKYEACVNLIIIER